jgi:hypothetical protein
LRKWQEQVANITSKREIRQTLLQDGKEDQKGASPTSQGIFLIGEGKKQPRTKSLPTQGSLRLLAMTRAVVVLD